MIALGISRNLRGRLITAPVLRIDKLLDEEIRKRFPFSLTRRRSCRLAVARDVQSGSR